MNKEAGNALKKLSGHNEEVLKMLKESEDVSRKLQTKIVIHEEDSEDDDPDKNEGIQMGNDKVMDVSLQKQKEDIVDKLVGMNSNIRNFTQNVEERLQRAYKAGNYTKKFGYEGLNTQNMDEDFETKSAMSSGPAGSMSTFEKILNKDNKKLNRLQTQAKSYLVNGSVDGGRSVMSSTSRLSSAQSQGALPDVHGKKASGRIGGIGGLRSARQGGAAGFSGIDPTLRA